MVRTTAALMSLSLAACATESGAPATEAELDSHRSAVQTDYEGYYDIVKSEADTLMAKSVGVLRNSDTDVYNYATCGVTFISPHFALTAAHCVKSEYGITPNSTRLTVEHWDVSAVSNAKIQAQAEVNGTWPQWSRGTTLTSDDGAVMQVWNDCVVRRRCDYGRSSCPFSQTRDIALLECRDRADDADWVPTASASYDDVGDEVSAWWFHELVDVPTEGSGERFDHYTKLGADKNENWHYRVYHQMIPLKSETRPDGSPYSALSRDSRGYTTTDMGACHGTSGSGVFQRGSSVNYGPVVFGGNTIGGRLCNRMDMESAGQANMSYLSPQFAGQFGALSQVTNDR